MTTAVRTGTRSSRPSCSKDASTYFACGSTTPGRPVSPPWCTGEVAATAAMMVASPTRISNPRLGMQESARRDAGRTRWRCLLALQQPHVGGLGALRPRRDVELDDLPLVERAVAVGLDRAEMHEDVLAGLGRDEPVALLGVEPLYGSSHETCPSLHCLGGIDHTGRCGHRRQGTSSTCGLRSET